MDYKGKILQKLMFNPNLRFTDMQIKDMTSKHFTYYLNKLKDEGLIEKRKKLYYLTNEGKNYIGNLNEKDMKVEKQPKISVALFVTRKNKNDKIEVLLSKRLKHPYMGRVGGFTGKIRFGESIMETAKRELKEEAGIEGKFNLSKIVRKFAHDKDKNIVQDQIFFIIHVTDIKGIPIKRNKENEVFWDTYDNIKKRKDLYNTFLGFLDIALNNKMENIELKVKAEGY